MISTTFYMLFANTPNGSDGSYLSIEQGSRRMYASHAQALERVRTLIHEEPTREYFIVQAVSHVKAADVPIVVTELE